MDLDRELHRFCNLFAALIALAQIPSLMLVYMMVLAQGVLGYGLTSILGAWLSRFSGQALRQYFRQRDARSPRRRRRGPWLTGLLHDLWGNYTIALRSASR